MSAEFPKIILFSRKKSGPFGAVLRVFLVIFFIAVIFFGAIGIYFFREQQGLAQTIMQRMIVIRERNTFLSNVLKRLEDNVSECCHFQGRLEQYSQQLYPLRSPKNKELEGSVIALFSPDELLNYSNSALEYFALIAKSISTTKDIFRTYPLVFPFASDVRIVLKRPFSAEADQLCPFTGAMQTHLGVDLAAELDTPILAPANGTVISVGNDMFYGRTVRIRHAGNYETFYGHMEQVFVRIGQTVTRATPIGTVGQSGWTTGPHLHYAIIRNGGYVDPLVYNFTLLYGD